MDKYLSIITNFGCHYTCPYCIVKENNLHIPQTTMDGLDAVGRYMEEYDCNWISISGGGDPLYKFEQHEEWYEKLFYLNMGQYKVELHTSYVLKNKLYGNFDRVVYHIRSLEDIDRIVRYGREIIRVVFVVTEDFTNDKIDTIVKMVKQNTNIDELSFRQMVDSNYNTTNYCQEYLELGHKKEWYYITQGDYNLYYCEGKVSTRYEDFK